MARDISERCANAAHALFRLFIINGITIGADFGKHFHELRGIGLRARGARYERCVKNLVHQFGATKSHNGPAFAGAEGRFDGADVALHANGLAAFEVVEVQNIGFVHHGQVNGFAGLFAQHIQKRLRHVGHIQTTANQSSHHEQIDAQTVTTCFGALF